jgi:hypothetical protein
LSAIPFHGGQDALRALAALTAGKFGTVAIAANMKKARKTGPFSHQHFLQHANRFAALFSFSIL